MRVPQIILLLLLTASVNLGLVSCSHDSDPCDDNPFFSSGNVELGGEFIEGMVYVRSNGKTTVLGTSDTSAKLLEQSQMVVSFNYDFYMGRHEVICKDFNDVMQSVSGIKIDCVEDSMPAANVTFFDAVLYVNALSKKNNLDSAYTYSSAVFDRDKHCVKMKEFRFKPTSDGFRLPTEAEWIMVASKNWMPEHGWNGENSGLVAHKVCTSNEPRDFFCDMAGNMLELVNDRYGAFKDTNVTNFVGAVDGEDVGSCVVKGGSYNNIKASMKLYSRSDVYPILSSTKGDYIGFRLARGPIPDATWFSDDGSSVSVPITSLIQSRELKKITKSYAAKLAFRNDVNGNLVYVDFAISPKIVQIEDKIDVFHPDISPDGKRVAFCTSMEGSSKESSIYVRDLNKAGSNLVKLPVERAAIPRWRVNPNGDTVIVYVSSAGNNKGEQFISESTWQVRFANGKFGTPEKLFDGAYHGGVSMDNRFAISSSPLLRARVANTSKSNDVIWYNGEQVCNASLAKDSSKRTLFLDFGGTLGRDFTGVNYGVHQRLLVADSTGALVHAVAPPDGDAFDHTEWAVGVLSDTANSLVVATLTDFNGNHKKVALIDFANDNVIPLVESSELWHPCLWVWQDNPNVPKPNVDLDSAGVYYDNNVPGQVSFASVELAMKLQSFWKKYEDVQVITFGSSMLLNAVNEDSIKSYNVLNMGVSMTDIYLSEYLIKHYVLPYAKKIKYLVVELTPGFLYRDYEMMTEQLCKTSPGIVYDETHLSEGTKKEIAELSKSQEYPKSLLGQQYLDGTFLLPSVEWGAPVVQVDLSRLPFAVPNVVYSLNVFGTLKRMTDSCGVTLIAAIPPRNPKYKDTDAFDLYGPSWEVAHQIIDAVKNMGIVIFDEYKDGHHDYTDEMANNPNHLSYLGAAQFSARLDAFLKTLK